MISNIRILSCLPSQRFLLLLVVVLVVGSSYGVVLPRGMAASSWTSFRNKKKSNLPTNVTRTVDDRVALSVASESSARTLTSKTRLALSKRNENDPLSTTDATSSPSSSKVLLTAALTALGAISLPAKLGLLPGPLLLPATDHIPYTDTYLVQDLSVTALTAVLGYIFVKLVTTAADRQYVQPRDSRKLIHLFSAPLFMFFWPLFSPATGSQWFAAIVPMLNAIRLYRAGTSAAEEMSLGAAVSRSGNANEALGGPFIYVILLATSILTFWRNSPVGIVAMATLAAGDGLADLIGRRWGKKNTWPGLKKSVAGSMAFWVGSWITSVGLLQWMQYWGYFCLAGNITNILDMVWRVGTITLLAAIVELIPIADDNYTVPLAAALGALWLLPSVVP